MLWCWSWVLRGFAGALVVHGPLGKPVQEGGQEGGLLGPTGGPSHSLGGSRGLLPAKGLYILVLERPGNVEVWLKT